MAIHSISLLLFLLFLISISHKTSAQIHTDSAFAAAGFQWPSVTSGYDGVELELDEDQGDGVESGIIDRRSLYWRSMHYYISYGALSANRIPCPARSGRSYYTHNCHTATGPAHPYTRGCSAITRCRR